MKVYNSVTEMVGNTPILKLNRIIAKENLSFHLPSLPLPLTII